MAATTRLSDEALVSELTPIAAELFDRHLRQTKEWFPHLLVPWSRGRDFDADEAWDPNEYPLPDAVRSSLFVNLLTEDNLPYYYQTISAAFSGEVWQSWARRWTAEENRHSIVIRDYLTVTRAIDPVDLERARMAQMSDGVVPQPDTSAEGFVYVALQELATRVAHRNTGKILDDRVGYDVMARVAADENFHYLFYRDLCTAAIELDPSSMVIAIEKQVRDFEMPGTGILNFKAHAKAIANAGIYDFANHYDQVLEPTIQRHWNLATIEGLDAEAEQARERTFAFIERLERVGRKVQRRRERQIARAAEQGETLITV